jgi:signal transduction histidine kinase
VRSFVRVRLATRLLVGSLLVVGVLVVVIVALVDRQLRTRLIEQFTSTLLHEAEFVATQWTAGVNSDSLADVAGRTLGSRVTLIAPDGRVLGDTDYSGDALALVGNLAAREEVVAAQDSGRGVFLRPVPAGTAVELYAAYKTARGVVRVSMPAERFENIIRSSRLNIAAGGFVALLAAMALAALFARAVSRPVVALRDVAQQIADGDLSQRPSLTAPGEVGELAIALHRLADQLSTRLEAHRAEQMLLSQLAESLNEGALAVDARQQIVRINDMARRLLGARERVPFSVELLPRDRTLRGAIADAVAGRSTDDAECQVHDRILRLTARPLEGGGAVVALLDLTPLRKADSVRRDFVANVSHELRTPLTVIGGFAETLATEDPPDNIRRQFAAHIQSNTRRMQRIVDELLDLSRIESGSWVPKATAVDFATCASDAIAASSHDAARKGIGLTVEADPAAATVWADPTALRQVIGNLVENAVRHTTAGAVTVFSTRVNGGVELGVRDTGSGIPAEHVPRIFERFYRVDAGRSRDEGGTGLGLSIVRHLVESHGGAVRAESEVGTGTTITAFFPEAAVTGP